VRSTALILALGLVAIAIAFGGCGGDMRPDELSRSIDTLISSAGEGRLIAEGVAEDRTKTTFVRVRTRELGETVDHESEKLSDATAEPEVAAEKRAAVAVAERISSVLGQLQVEPTDEATASAAERNFARLASRAERLQGSL
jgi:hypothetical protein